MPQKTEPKRRARSPALSTQKGLGFVELELSDGSKAFLLVEQGAKGPQITKTKVRKNFFGIPAGESRFAPRRYVYSASPSVAVSTEFLTPKFLAHDLVVRERPTGPAEEVQITSEDWDEIKRQALEQVEANNLDPPEKHLAYVRGRIVAGLARDAV